jgi:predicted O-methyltransferase YrrM
VELSVDTKTKEQFRSLYSQRYAIGRKGKQFELSSGMDYNEIELIYETIWNDKTVLRTMEIGCAVGYSSLAITSALRDRQNSHHTIIDPFQTTEWDGAGLALLERNCMRNFDLIEQRSELALPSMLTDSNLFDFILIDGWHTFDHTIVDLFYSCRLLRVGGYLAIDDTSWPGVGKAVAYYNNFPSLRLYATPPSPTLVGRSIRAVLTNTFQNDCLRKLVINACPTRLLQRLNRSRYGSMVILRKTMEDERNYDWYSSF